MVCLRHPPLKVINLLWNNEKIYYKEKPYIDCENRLNLFLSVMCVTDQISYLRSAYPPSQDQ